MRIRALVGLAVATTLCIAGILPAGADTGIDVSNYQHPNGAAINWGAVRAAGQSFVFIKATEGPNGTAPEYVNPWFSQDWAGAGSAGMLRGAYDYAHPSLPTSNALIEARSFVAVTGSMQGAADLPPVLDLEETDGLSPADLVTWTATWLFEVERLTGRRPMIYTGLDFWNNATGGSTAFGAYRLWFARYVGGNDPGQLPNGFLTWTFWQQSSTGSVAGVPANVDVDNYCCPDGNLHALAGPTPGNSNAGSPFGSLDVTAALPDGEIRVAGWAIDPDTPGTIEINSYVDGHGVNLGQTTAQRADVGALYGQFGPEHGFDWTGNGYAPGPHRVCTFALNQAYGSNTLLGCRTVVVPAGSPIGHVDVETGLPDGHIYLGGWALDFDTAAPIEVDVYVDGHGYDTGPASVPRPDIAALAPAWGPNHGFGATLSGIGPGPHQVCTYALNLGVGSNTLLGCHTVEVPGGTPIGHVDVAQNAGGGMISLGGWALDFDTAGPIEVDTYVDGHGFDLGLASVPRPDIGALAPAWGPDHGFNATIGPFGAGPHQVCTFALNVGVGSNRLLECRTVTT